MQNELYVNPLITRYASKEMSEAFSDKKKYSLWRKLWVALAKSERELGLNISEEQINDLEKYVDDVNFDVARAYEREVRHEVMSHVKAYADQAKLAAGIIHLGATSNFVIDNAEIIMIDNALDIIIKKLVNVVSNLKIFALKYKDLPTLGFTHFQAAQLTTVGKRATLWMQDLLIDLENLEFLKSKIKLRGVKGTTGTQASFMNLFDGNVEKILKLDELVVEKMGYNRAYSVTGQTYPRKFDYEVLSALSKVAQSAFKFSNDLRLLQHLKEIEEPFEKNQIGSSAMAYKRNPMRSERIGSLARFVLSLPINASITSSLQWFERTLDDSANKRIVIPQCFMALDGILNLYMNVTENMVVYEKVVLKHVQEELPFMATENIIMQCVKAGGNRQELHERIRVYSMKASENIKALGKNNNLLDLIEKDPIFYAVKDRLDEIVNPVEFTGIASIQVENFINKDVNPVLIKYKNYLGEKAEISC